MAKREGTGDGPGSEEHINALIGPSSSTNSLAKTISGGHGSIPSHDEEHVNASDVASSSTKNLTEATPGPTIAQPNLAGLVAPPGQTPAQPNVEVVAAIAAPPRLAPAYRVIQDDVGVIANAIALFAGAHNEGVAAMDAPTGPALALEPYFNIDTGLSGPPLRRTEVGPFF